MTQPLSSYGNGLYFIANIKFSTLYNLVQVYWGAKNLRDLIQTRTFSPELLIKISYTDKFT